MRTIVVIAHNLRSCHNVGSLLRTAEGLGASKVILSGYTPYPLAPNDTRLPFVAQKIDRRITKTALGAAQSIAWEHVDDVFACIQQLQNDGFEIVALEQTKNSLSLPDYAPPQKLAILVGREVEGVEPAVIDACDICVEIPMYGRKESFNVVQAAAMCLYYCRFYISKP